MIFFFFLNESIKKKPKFSFLKKEISRRFSRHFWIQRKEGSIHQAVQSKEMFWPNKEFKKFFKKTPKDRKHLMFRGFASASGWSGNPVLITTRAAPDDFLKGFLEGPLFRSLNFGLIYDEFRRISVLVS